MPTKCSMMLHLHTFKSCCHRISPSDLYDRSPSSVVADTFTNVFQIIIDLLIYDHIWKFNWFSDVLSIYTLFILAKFVHSLWCIKLQFFSLYCIFLVVASVCSPKIFLDCDLDESTTVNGTMFVVIEISHSMRGKKT
jgi:hypothetical protein